MRSLALLLLLLLGCKPDGVVPLPEPEPQPTGNMSIKLQHHWESPANTFYPETWYVHSATTDSILFNKLRYYLSGFYFVNTDSQRIHVPATHRLVAVNGVFLR